VQDFRQRVLDEGHRVMGQQALRDCTPELLTEGNKQRRWLVETEQQSGLFGVHHETSPAGFS
jgi:hypothetical protein